MKISDILTEEDHFGFHRADIDQMMNKAGYKEIGGGFDSQVYAKDSGQVIKILIPRRDTIRLQKFPFLSFYLYCRAHPNNVHLPKFINIEGKPWKDFSIGNERFVQIAMERLRPVKIRSILNPILQTLSGRVAHGDNWKGAMSNLMDKSAFRTFGLNRSVQLSSQWAEMMKDQKYRDMFEVIFETMRDLVLIGRRRGYEWDLHANNFMMRGDTPVIIDPWVNETMHESTDPENG